MLTNIQSDAAESNMEERQSLPTLLPDVAPLRTQRGFQGITPGLPISLTSPRQPTNASFGLQVFTAICVIFCEIWNIFACTRPKERRWPL